MLFTLDSFLDVEMAKKGFYPKHTRRDAFWGNRACYCCMVVDFWDFAFLQSMI